MQLVSEAATPAATAPALGIAVTGTGILGAAWVLPGIWSSGVNPVPPCIFHLVTGRPCPFCGATRSFVAIAHGNLGAAVHVYPLGPLLFAGLVLGVVLALVALAGGRRLRLALSPGERRLLLGVGLGLLALNWAAKLVILGY